MIFDEDENIWTFDTSFEDFQNIYSQLKPDAIMHYTIKESWYQDVVLLSISCEWIKFKQHVKECKESRQVVMKTSDNTAWDSPDTEWQKTAEMASKIKTMNTEAAKIEMLQKTVIKKKMTQKKWKEKSNKKSYVSCYSKSVCDILFHFFWSSQHWQSLMYIVDLIFLYVRWLFTNYLQQSWLDISHLSLCLWVLNWYYI